MDELLKSQYDPETGEMLPCWNTVNTDNKPENELEAQSIVFDLKAQHIQTKIITDFIDAVDSGKLALLEHRRDSEFTDADHNHAEERIVPYIQTDFLFEEVANLKLQHGAGATLRVEKALSKMNKDRWSSLAYCIYYIMEYENNYTYKDISEMDILSEYTFV